jgi:hypothetical protein
MNRVCRRSRSWLTLAFAFALRACTCDRITSEQTRSPDGRHQAVVFSDVCGYNVSLNTQVAVIPSDQTSRWKVNAFRAINGDPLGPTNAGGGPAVHARWAANDTLELTYHASAAVRTRNERVGEVVIRYVVNTTPE